MPFQRPTSNVQLSSGEATLISPKQPLKARFLVSSSPARRSQNCDEVGTTGRSTWTKSGKLGEMGSCCWKGGFPTSHSYIRMFPNATFRRQNGIDFQKVSSRCRTKHLCGKTNVHGEEVPSTIKVLSTCVAQAVDVHPDQPLTLISRLISLLSMQSMLGTQKYWPLMTGFRRGHVLKVVWRAV